jgi:hypothetical protein
MTHYVIFQTTFFGQYKNETIIHSEYDDKEEAELSLELLDDIFDRVFTLVEVLQVKEF